jgi:predicted RNA-binding protein with PIN domain
MTPSRSAQARGPAWDLLVVDGHSLMHREPTAKAHLGAARMLSARRCLIERLERLTGSIAGQIEVVFDGQGRGGAGEEFSGSAVHVTFSPSGTTADLVIERRVRAAPDPRRVLVVTSDRLERESVDAAGAAHMGCGDFLEWIRTAEEDLARTIRRPVARAPGLSLGDCFPDVATRPEERGG